MNNRALTLAVVIAAIAVWLVYSWATEYQEKFEKQFGDQVTVVKARRDIKEGESLNQEMIGLDSIPKKYSEPSAFAFASNKKIDDEEVQRTMKSLSGSVAIVPIRKGEVLTYSKISEPGTRTGLAPQVAPGRRAIAINVSDQSSVGKLIKPGDRVDVIAVVDTGGGKESKVAKTILQDIVVLSVGKNVTNNIPRVVEIEGGKEKVRSLSQDTSYGTISLEVDPQQAQIMVLLMNNGENALTLSLRNNDDTERTNLVPIMLSDILGTGGAPRIPAGQRR